MKFAFIGVTANSILLKHALRVIDSEMGYRSREHQISIRFEV